MPGATLRITGTHDPRWREVVALRHDVFVVGQRVPLDIEQDGLDPDAWHVVAELGPDIVGTLRVLPEGDTAHIGRVAVRADQRRRGLAARMMLAALDEARARGFARALLHSQSYIAELYEKLGFVVQGEPFEEAGIEHVTMVRNIS